MKHGREFENGQTVDSWIGDLATRNNVNTADCGAEGGRERERSRSQCDLCSLLLLCCFAMSRMLDGAYLSSRDSKHDLWWRMRPKWKEEIGLCRDRLSICFIMIQIEEESNPTMRDMRIS